MDTCCWTSATEFSLDNINHCKHVDNIVTIIVGVVLGVLFLPVIFAILVIFCDCCSSVKDKLEDCCYSIK